MLRCGGFREMDRDRATEGPDRDAANQQRAPRRVCLPVCPKAVPHHHPVANVTTLKNSKAERDLPSAVNPRGFARCAPSYVTRRGINRIVTTERMFLSKGSAAVERRSAKGAGQTRLRSRGAAPRPRRDFKSGGIMQRRRGETRNDDR